jgi:signal transduction histidine kinase
VNTFRLLPKSLAGRVFALYALALAAFVFAGLALFHRYQFGLELEGAQRRAESLVQVIAPTVSDSAVIGDYDTIERTLERAIEHSDFASAVFIDAKGHSVRATGQEVARVRPPDWLAALVDKRLYDTHLPITAGGRDYGVLRLSFASERVAGNLWRQARVALLLGLAALAGGLLALRLPLRRWLGDFERLQAFESALAHGSTTPGGQLGSDAPTELKNTFDVLNRVAATAEVQRGRAETALAGMRGALEALMPSARRPAGGDDIEALSALVGSVGAAMRERGEQLSAIFELSPDGFVSFDAAHCVSYASPAFTRLTGLAADEVLGLGEGGFLARLAPLCPSGVTPDFARLRQVASNAHDRCTLELHRPARRVLALALREAPGGSMVSQVLLLRDITHETEVDKMKSEFLATAAHELRTPMSSIYGFTELMMMVPMKPERQRQTLETVHRQTELMIKIVNELLDLARIEARRGKDFQIEPMDLGTMVDAVLRDFRPPEGREPPQWVRPAWPVPVHVDRQKLTQAINNVLSNAYKYSPQGGPVVVTLSTPQEGARRPATLAVRDRGIGMSEEQLARVCERFYRADASGAIPGTGLGMAIVKEIVELHGGSLTLASEPGQGTTVTMAVPAD